MGRELCCKPPRGVRGGFEKTMFGWREVFSGCHSNIYHKTSRPLCKSSTVNIHGVHDGIIMAQRWGKKSVGRCRTVVEIRSSSGVWCDWKMIFLEGGLDSVPLRGRMTPRRGGKFITGHTPLSDASRGSF